MVNSIASLNSTASMYKANLSSHKSILVNSSTKSAKDTVEFGMSGMLSMEDSMNIVVERALDKLRGVVTQAREELGLPENAVLDTSPEATADRITTFALGFWTKYAEQHKLEDTEENRKQFADFIGAAINQGIGEARSILGSLNVLNSDVDGNITKISDIIQQRLQDFIVNGLSGKRE
ncbi:MAG TPA: DUF5610 domain-containing protein [Candidatus Hydrogenedentes bacterium]|nr:DUF5610 domain-containing protein [Candidatus Hydrogenedentota bacterium]